jgi:hypothetical protein
VRASHAATFAPLRYECHYVEEPAGGLGWEIQPPAVT